MVVEVGNAARALAGHNPNQIPQKDTVVSVKTKFGNSLIWKAIMKVKEHYLAGRKVVLKSGNLARVWDDSINDQPPLCSQFPAMYSICNNQGITVASFRNGVDDNFFQDVSTPLLDQWRDMQNAVGLWLVTNEPGQVVWSLGRKKNKFTTKSIYDYLEKI